MDENVKRAIERWPDVPAAFGWLRLDRRGKWYLIDRNAPGFTEAEHGQGSLISSEPIIEFISRNYLHDDKGRWFWQNGPQKAYADLDLAPLILRVVSGARGQALVTHTGYPVERVEAAFVSESGELFVQTDLGPGAIHDLDLSALELTEDHLTLDGRELALQTLDGPPGPALGFVTTPR